MRMPEKASKTAARRRGVADLREDHPRGAKQFAAIVDTKMTATSPPKAKRAAPKGPPIKGFADEDIKKLRETEKRYAASRRAATSGGRDTLYD